MNSDTINDLKQFISTTLSQQLTLQTGELREEFNQRFDAIDQRFDEVDRRFDDVYQRFDNIDRRFDRAEDNLNVYLGAIQENFDEHDTRIKRLEKRRA